MFSPRPRRDAGVTILEITGVLVALSVALTLVGSRHSLFRPPASDYFAAARYFADKGEIERQGAGVISQHEAQVSFAPTISLSVSTPQGVVARFADDGRSYAVYSRARMLTPALLDKINLYREAVR